ncbi:uncharacterized protein PAC_03139 [Phialocephala subalpina]|uniref:Uncharacterized protein n=1 Tax=Phialocephala subalpina TaxID=576137 RepID=A0A1L7WKG9_9HELO|nr:uncharacterized protein PAC_03139 [Phialocephala subalpina]
MPPRHHHNNDPPREDRLVWQDIFLKFPNLRFDMLLSTPFETLFKTQWNINRNLGRFVSNPVAFRSVMACHEAFISGSFALQFFARTTWKESDLDIYVSEHPPERAAALGNHLIEREGYALDNTKGPETFQAYHDVDSMSKIISAVTRNTPIEVILGGFCTIAVVNVITWKLAYSIFPDATFREMKTYQLRPLNDYYEDEERVRSISSGGSRRIGDSLSWKIPLDTTGVTPGLPDHVLEFSIFGLSKHTPDPQLFDLEELTYMELMKLDEQSRPIDPQEFFRGELCRSSSQIHRDPPKSWTFFDDLIPEWFEAWQKRQAKMALEQPRLAEHNDMEVDP